MPTNGHNLEERVVLPPNGLDMRPTGRNNNNHNHNINNNNNQEFNARDRLFYKVTLWYARIFPRSLRRVIEFLLLLKAVLSFFVLVYVHMNFLQMTANCLDHVKDVWPRDGILRVEIIQGFQRSDAEQTGTIIKLSTLEKSYEPEYKLKRMDISDKNATLFNRFTKTNSPKNKRMVDIESSTEELVENKFPEIAKPNLFNYLSFKNYINIKAIFYSNYIIEYSLEYGLLRLSPSARNRSSIPVMLVSLEPTRNKCYGNSVRQFFLEYFLGYEDILLSSVKSLTENEQNKGFMRNVITGEYYKFESISMARTLYIESFFIMILFTLLISMLMRYLNHQIFVFIESLQQVLNVHSSLSFPTAALLSVLLALVGMVAIISELLDNRITAFYVILIVWLADQYDTMCSRCPITKRHWLKFFYLYLLSFYAYHFRFKGQYSNLALICSWFFIQHSMIYFYHHYEMLHVLQRAQSE